MSLCCADCKGDVTVSTGNYYMIENELWKQISKNEPNLLLCLKCAQIRLGRAFKLKDFKITPKQMFIKFLNNSHTLDEKDKQEILETIKNTPEYIPYMKD